MTPKNGLFTSESVSSGHPDKLADRISDRILDAALARQCDARVACETMVTGDCVILAGEFRFREAEDFKGLEAEAATLARGVLRDTGYLDAAIGIDPDRCTVQVRFVQQSEDIGRGVDREDGTIGAGDQGLMFGYASSETSTLMPAPIALAHSLIRRQETLRCNGVLPWLRPDAKAQVTLRYAEGTPVAVAAVVLSTQHDETVSTGQLHDAVLEEIIRPVLPAELDTSTASFYVNPTGRFVTGGPSGDVGLTGRKIIVDTYGGAAPHGGGAFSGKDPSKVDRSAAYMARRLAVEIVEQGWANRALVQLAYAIGVAEPVALLVQLDEPGDERRITETLRERFDLTPRGIIDELELECPIYYPTAAHGHFGRKDLRTSWK